MQIEAVSINGRLQSPDQAVLSAVDRGIMFAHGAFETFRVSGGKIFLYEEHLARLDKNLKALNINWTYKKEIHAAWINAMADTVPVGKDGRIRFCVTSGTEDGQPSVIIYLSFIDKFKPVEKKAQILESIIRHQPEYFQAVGFRIKSLEYSYLCMAQKEIGNDKDAGILLNPQGYVAEALTANIFWAKDDKLYTPPLSLGILAGTMRGWLIDNFKVEEKLAQAEELLQTDEVFLTAGASYLTAISQVNVTKKAGIGGQVYQKVYSTLLKHLPENSSVL